MKKHLLLFTALSALFFTSCYDFNEAQPEGKNEDEVYVNNLTENNTSSSAWHPLAAGNSWTYLIGDTTVTLLISGTESANGNTYFISKKDESGYKRFRYDSKGNFITQYVDASGVADPEDVIIPANPVLNYTWDSSDGESSYKVESLNATFGQYTGLLKITTTNKTSKTTEAEDYIKKGVGFVCSISYNGNEKITSTLTTYQIK